ncbi:MAG: exonuclease domain-containing protein [Bacteroidia bacterium]
MFAIVDIETCGGKFEYRRGRITEICIVQHDGLQVTNVYTTLINPECNISPFYTNITGITNEMVQDAPKFHEIANNIWELTEGRVFVAHNVGFDYNFIKDEFSSLGAKFKRETLCTVRLSRKLMPGKLSYSLGNLCESLGIENSARHRAEGDAIATAKLFDLLLQIKSTNPELKNKGVDEIMTRRIDKMKKYILDKLPEECGVYYFYNKDGQIIYIGKSVNAYNRALSHFNSTESKGKKMLNELYSAGFTNTGSELIALLLETEEIKKHQPKFNRMRKATVYSHCIDWFIDEKQIVNFRIVEYDFSENALCTFVSYLSARERLEQWIEDYSLCLKYCGLTGEDSVCFNHQIKNCLGICAEEESPDEYNLRAHKVLANHQYSYESFAVIDKGRNLEERAIIVIENNHFIGYAYLNEFDSFSSMDELKGYLRPVNHFPEADELIRTWMKKNKSRVLNLAHNAQKLTN